MKILKTTARSIIFAILALTAVVVATPEMAAGSICDNFVNTCNVPGLTNFTINHDLTDDTGEPGEPLPSTDWAPDENPLTTSWFHWTAPQSGNIIVDTAGTNPNALPPAYEFPFVIDTLISVYTGPTLTTLVRRNENDNWGFGGGCTNPRPLTESTRSSCMTLAVTAGTTYHFQVDKFAEANPNNNFFLFNVRFAVATAATVPVGGRITNANGIGISRVRVSLTKPNGEVVTTLTTSFGYYSFEAIEAGQNYTLEASSKRFRFHNNPRIIWVGEQVQNEDFIATDNVRRQ